MKELQELLEIKWQRVRLLQTEIDRIVNLLRVTGCDHTGAESYKWEHDNGYGRQTKIEGKRCVYCGFVDHWNRGNFINPTEIGN